jgi:hypothetical protein
MDREFRKAIARLSRKKRKVRAPVDERECFCICDECGQAFDTRSIAQVVHHEELGHEPLSESELTDLTLAEWTSFEKWRGSTRR